MADLLNIGVSGLLAYQRSITTTSHNITNSSNEGYRRQTVDLSTQVPQALGSGYVGTGVKVDGIKRSYDQFLEGQVTNSLSLFKQEEAYFDLASELDNFLADPTVGISPVLQGFFKSLNDLSSDPSSTPAREVLLQDAETLSTVFNDTYSKLQNLNNAVNLKLSTSITEINNLSKAIADINEDILLAQGSSSVGFRPNDLLDQRQTMVNQLAELVTVSTVEQTGGALNVYIGSGQALVTGTNNQILAATRNEYDTSQYEIGIKAGTTTVDITQQLRGGKIGGLLGFRSEVLEETYNMVGRVAMALSEDVNDQHQLGLDLNNQAGADFFTDVSSINSLSSRHNNASSDYLFTASISDSSKLEASGYRLDYSSASGGTYSLTRLSDDTVIGSSTSLATLSSTVSAAEGFTIALASGTSIVSGDKFLISPVRNAARDFAVDLTHTNQIAAASPLVFSENSANTGDARFGTDGLQTRTGTTLPATPVSFTYDSTANEFNISTGGTISYDPTTDSGTQFTVAVAGLGTHQFTVTGIPANGDVFSLGSNAGGGGDNRNVMQLIGLQQQKTISDGTTNYQESYSELVSQIGVKTKRADFSQEANQVLYERAVSSQQAKSGVNLDEEAADLIRFQQAYQAVARVITTADQLFQALLGAVSR